MSDDDAADATEEEPAENGSSEGDSSGDEPAENESPDDKPATADGGDDTPIPVGVKLGSTRTVVALPEPDGTGHRIINTLTCMATYEDALTGEEKILYGEEAAREYPDRVQYMLRSGLPEDGERAEMTKRFFEALIEENDIPENSGVVYAIPTIDNPAGLENLRSVIEDSSVGLEFIESYPESLCGSIPAFGDGLDAIDEMFISVNMGSTNLEASAYRRGEQLAPFTTGAITGNEVDRRITNYVEGETQGRVNIDTQTAREYKEDHANFIDFEPFTDVIQQPGGGTHEFSIERSVMDAVNEYLDEAVDELANTFLPELANDYMRVYKLALDRPIVLTGGMACIPGIVEEFEERLSEELNRDIEAIAADRPDVAPTIGAQRIAARLVENS